MSDINPEFSFPASSSSPRSVPNLPPAPIHSSRPLSYSPQPRPRRHAHRRSAAMSEDISAVEIAALTSPTAVPQLTLSQDPAPAAATFITPEGTPEGTPENTPQGAHRSNDINTGSPSSVKFIEPLAAGLSTPARSAKLKPPLHPKIPTPLPTGTMPSRPVDSPRSFADSRSLDARSPFDKPFDKPFDTHSVGSDFDRADRFDYSSAVLPKKPKQIGEPGGLVLNQSPPSTQSGRSSSDLAAELRSDAKSEKRKKRRSFVQLFKRDSSSENTTSSKSTPHGVKNERSKLRSPDSPLRARSPPASPIGDDTLVPSQPQQLQQSLRTPQSQYAVQFTSPPFTPSQRQSNSYGVWGPQSPVSTPRNSGEMLRDAEPLPPTIDLDEALSCSFSHRQSDPLLESPFSKTSSAMGAVLEEEEDDEHEGGRRGGSETDSVNSRRSAQSRHRVSILQKSNSVCSNASSSRNNQAPASPRFVTLPAKQVSSGEPRSISYVGPMNFAPSPPRSPRLGFEQVSNLAISEPNLETTEKRMSMPPPQTPQQQQPVKSHHRRRRSLIDRLMRR